MTRFSSALIYLLLSGTQAWAWLAAIPLREGSQELGEVQVEVEEERLLWVDREGLLKVLGPRLQEDTRRNLEKLPERVNPEVFPLPLRYNPETLTLETKLDLSVRSREKTNLGLDLSEQARLARRPAPFGGAINYNLEKAWAHEELGGNSFNGQFDSFLNMNSLVLEGQSYYLHDDTQKKWYRGDTRLVKDFQEHEIRSQLGDVYPSVQGFMVGRPIGGINIQRNFALNPYRLPYPTGNQNFTLKSRSFVRYFVNSVLIKSEYLPPGNYSADDIPLSNGLNTIVIEATDDLGQKQVFTFRASSSINLLNRGEARFDLSYGTPFVDTNLKREYVEDEGKFFSGFLQYGFTRTFSSSVYLQNQLDYNLFGTELIGASTIGNLTAGHARSEQGELTGGASALGYQLITQGERWFDSHTLNLRFENRSEGFRGGLLELNSAVKNIYSANYTIPLSSLMTLAVGGNYGDVRDNSLNDRYGMDANVSIRLFRDHSLSAFVARNRDEFKRWNEVAYVFLTFTFPESNNYLSTLYDHSQKSTRVTYLRDNQNRLRDFRTQVTAEDGEETQAGEVDLLYPTTFANLGARMNGRRDLEDKKSLNRAALRLSSAVVFAYEDGEFATGLSRPVPGSFVIFSPEERLKGQQIALRSTSPYNEASTGPLGEITFSNLLAYQYRDVQLDPSYMDEGRSLVREKFVLYPTYRSAHLIRLEERGSVSLSGILLDHDGKPLTLQVGSVNGTTFFTNRDGVFFIEGVEPGELRLGLDGRSETIVVPVDKDRRGMIDLGQLQFKEEP